MTFAKVTSALSPPVNLHDNKFVESRKSRPLASGWTASYARPAAYSLGLVVGLAVRCNCHRVRRRCLAFGARETGRRGAAEILRGLRLPGCRRGTLAGVGSGGQLAFAYLYEWFMFLARVRRRVHRTVRSSARASLCPISRTRSAPQVARRRLKKDRVWGHADYRGGPCDPGPTSGSYCRRTRRRPIDTPHSSVGLRGRMPGPVTRFCWSFRHVWPFQVAHDQA